MYYSLTLCHPLARIPPVCNEGGGQGRRHAGRRLRLLATLVKSTSLLRRKVEALTVHEGCGGRRLDKRACSCIYCRLYHGRQRARLCSYEAVGGTWIDKTVTNAFVLLSSGKQPLARGWWQCGLRINWPRCFAPCDSELGVETCRPIVCEKQTSGRRDGETQKPERYSRPRERALSTIAMYF